MTSNSNIQDDISLIQIIKENNDSNALQELVNRHTGIYINTINKCLKTDNATVRDDIFNQRFSNFYKYVLDYDPSKNMKFPTYVGERTRFLCKTINSSPEKILCEPIEIQIPDSTNYQNRMENKELLSNLLDAIDHSNNEIFIEIVKLRFFSGPKLMTWHKIGKEIGMTHEGVRKIYNLNINKIKKNLNKVA